MHLLGFTLFNPAYGPFLSGRDLAQELLEIPTVEVMCIDGRQRNKNGVLLADFFDFT